MTSDRDRGAVEALDVPFTATSNPILVWPGGIARY